MGCVSLISIGLRATDFHLFVYFIGLSHAFQWSKFTQIPYSNALVGESFVYLLTGLLSNNTKEHSSECITNSSHQYIHDFISCTTLWGYNDDQTHHLHTLILYSNCCLCSGDEVIIYCSIYCMTQYCMKQLLCVFVKVIYVRLDTGYNH